MTFVSIFYISAFLIVRSQSAPYLNEYLVHYWPLDNSDMSDFVGHAHMSQGTNTTFATDRFGNLNSALSLNGGYTQVPPGYFFDTDQFTISAWVYPDQLGINSRVMDFGNGDAIDNIFLSLTYPTPAVAPTLGMWYSKSIACELFATPLTNKKWQFLAATFNNQSAYIYIDGVAKASKSNITYLAQPILRSNNYIGKGNFFGDGYSYSYLDDLRFYNLSLSQSQVVKLMKSQNPSKNTLVISFFSYL